MVVVGITLLVMEGVGWVLETDGTGCGLGLKADGECLMGLRFGVGGVVGGWVGLEKVCFNPLSLASKKLAPGNLKKC